jgi:hypothetical protein
MRRKITFKAVFRIRNVWIRTWISGPFNWITDPDLDPALVFSVFEGAKKSLFLLSFLLFNYITLGTFKSVFKDNKLLRSYKTVEIKDFRKFF